MFQHLITDPSRNNGPTVAGQTAPTNFSSDQAGLERAGSNLGLAGLVGLDGLENGRNVSSGSGRLSCISDLIQQDKLDGLSSTAYHRESPQKVRCLSYKQYNKY